VTKAVFLDRDGVINRKAPGDEYVTRWKDFELLPGVVEAIAELNRSGVCVIVITNQRCIAKGLITTAELDTMHQHMMEFLTERGARLDAIYYCPHEMEPACRCRKPSPGMFFDAARDYGIELATSWMIGDSDIDIEAGKNAGCKTAILFDEPYHDASMRPRNGAELVANSLLEAVRQILLYENGHAGPEISVPAAPCTSPLAVRHSSNR
jgi:D-glycero-D-manno-heptose 1,7-bisphosphate phosphatase